MSKRRATDELYGDSTKRAEHPSRREEFTANLRVLNSSFAQWVQQQAAQAGDQLWLAAVKDYASHAEKLLEDFDDVLLNGKQHRSSPPLANNLFGTPAAANGPDHALPGPLSAGVPGGGRKSVTFASGPTTFSTPSGSGTAAGTATAATPGTSNTTNAGHTPAPGTSNTANAGHTPAPGTSNTANAGHTPAPASGLSFQFAATPGFTPGPGSEMPSPQPFKLGTPGAAPGSAGDIGATPSPAPSSVFTFGNGSGASAAGTPASTAGFGTPVPTPASAKGFTFGTSSSTPAGQDSTAAAGTSSIGVAFSFGATPAADNSGAGAAPATGGSTGGFSFGATPAGGGGTPAFGFASTGAAGSSTSGGFNFPAPAAVAAGAADAAASNEAEEGDEPPKHKLELKVDEDKWKVLFTSKAKLHLLVNGSEWSGRGVGMLTMRQPKDNEGKTYIVFSTEGGKQLVASPLMGNTKVTPVDKTPRCRMLLLVPQYQLPPSGTKADAAATPKTDYQLQGCMFSFGTEEKVRQFAKLVDEHKPAAKDK